MVETDVEGERERWEREMGERERESEREREREREREGEAKLVTRAKERRAAATPLLPVFCKERAVKGPCHCCPFGAWRTVPSRERAAKACSMKDSSLRFMCRGRGGQLVPQERWASVTALLSVWRKERAAWRTVTAEKPA